jgi:fructose-1,6-bisphosphatase II / sedoheptulose-1,7-bisphosphatase
MDKIAIGGGFGEVVDLDEKPATNLANLAKAKKVDVPIWSSASSTGRAMTARPDSGVDLYVGSGGAPEGVLAAAAAALRCIGGFMQGRLVFRNDDEKGRAKRIGIKDLNRKYGLLDLAKGNVMFAATGVTSGTSGTMLQGIRRIPGGAP